MPEVEVNSTATRKQSKADQNGSRPKTRPATTIEGRENQLISLAVDVAEEQLRRGTASAQVITHYLKLGTTRERLEQERLRGENSLLVAKVQAIASEQKREELYEKALEAMRVYSGHPEDESAIAELHGTRPDR